MPHTSATLSTAALNFHSKAVSCCAGLEQLAAEDVFWLHGGIKMKLRLWRTLVAQIHCGNANHIHKFAGMGVAGPRQVR